MWSYVARRLLLIIPVLLGVAIIVFAMVRMVPGDPAIAIAGVHATEEYITQVRTQMRLDEPLHIQFGVFLRDLLGGDLGRSARTRRPVTAEVGERFVNTLQLAVVALVLATFFGIGAGVISATKPYSIFDNITMLFALFGVAAPVFWLGLMLMLLFSIQLGWLPSAGKGTLAHLILPSITLAAHSMALIARMTRSCMLEVLGLDFITTARAKGLASRVIIIKHALKNAMIPVITVLGMRLGILLGGAVLTETVFAWPGVGRLVVDSIQARDYPVIQGAVLYLAVFFVLINLAVDILYYFLDPRIQYN